MRRIGVDGTSFTLDGKRTFLLGVSYSAGLGAPDAAAWQLVINKQNGQWGTSYDEKQDLARVPMTVTKLAAPVEQFTIAVEPSALVMRWENTQASVPLKAAK